MIDLATPKGIRRSVPIFAWAINRGAIGYTEAFDLLMSAFFRTSNISSDKKLLQAEYQLHTRLTHYIGLYEGMTE